MNTTNTTNLRDFGNRELAMAADLLNMWINDGLPEYFDGESDHIWIEFNPNSGCVFLSNDDCETAMINDESGELALWLSCPDCGHEGFLTDFEDDIDNLNDCCKEYLKELEQ